MKMIPALIVVVSILALLQFFYSYCRSIIANASKTKLSENVLELSGVKSGTVSHDEFRKLLQLIEICPTTDEDQPEIRIVRIYYSLLGLLQRVSRWPLPPLAVWAGQERRACSYFAAVALERRIAYSRKFISEQEKT